MTIMNMRTTVLVLLTLCTLGACHYGPNLDKFPSAQTAKGVVADITTDRPFIAELIEVRESELVIFADRKFRLLPYRSIESFGFYGMKGRLDIGNQRVPSASTRDYLRLVSRFPQGLNQDLLQKLLAANGQTTLASENP